MSNLFEVSDPRGHKIICTEDCWNEHILFNRPWMIGWENEVQKAIESPHMGIFQDNAYKNREIYYGLSAGKERYIKVVVESKDQNYGEVITAFPTDSPKSGERMIWPTSKD